MDTVLIVEDDKSFQLSLTEGFKAYKDKFQTAVANDGLEALTILNKQKVNLVLTDLKMPRMDGFELMAHLTSNYPDIPVIVMTAFGTPDMEQNLMSMGAFQYIEKPIDFSSLVEKILHGLESTSTGFVTGVSLASFMQLLELDKKTCTLTVHSGSETGTIYFKKGDIIDAVSRNRSGLQAAYEIVGWNDVKIEIVNTCLVEKREINEPLGFILLEATRQQDELNGEQEQPPEKAAPKQAKAQPKLAAALAARAVKPIQPSAKPRPRPKAAKPTDQSPAAKTMKPIDQFISLLNSKLEISGYIILSKAGKVVLNKISGANQLGAVVTYMAAASEEIKAALGTGGGRQFVHITLSGEGNILILTGKQLIVGIQVSSTTQPELISDRLHDALNKVTLN